MYWKYILVTPNWINMNNFLILINITIYISIYITAFLTRNIDKKKKVKKSDF